MAAALAHHMLARNVYVECAGVKRGELDPFAVEVMEELGIDISSYHPKTFEDLADTSFDLIVSLSPEAHHKAVDLTHTEAITAEYWPTMDPTLAEGTRDQRLAAYRAVRDGLIARLKKRFPQIRMGDL